MILQLIYLFFSLLLVRPIDDASDKSTKIKKGSKIGKMQLSRSGKVVLILTDGRKFEVTYYSDLSYYLYWQKFILFLSSSFLCSLYISLCLYVTFFLLIFISIYPFFSLSLSRCSPLFFSFILPSCCWLFLSAISSYSISFWNWSPSLPA